MINIKIIFLSLLTDITEVEELNLPIDDNSTIRTVLELLAKKFGEKFEELIYKTSSNLSEYVIITINGKDIKSLEGIETKIQLDDELSFIPAIAGG